MKASGFLVALALGGATFVAFKPDAEAKDRLSEPAREKPLELVFTASNVTTYQPEGVGLNWIGAFVALEDRNIPGRNVVLANDKRSKMRFLGCAFDMQPRENDTVLQIASEALSKVTRGTPTSAYGYLTAPQRGGIEDPLIDLACDDSRAYYYFVFRNRVGFSDNFDHSTLVLEYQKGGLNPFDNPYPWWGSNLSKSRQAALITENMEQMYVIPYTEQENKVLAEKESKEVRDFLIDAVPKVLGL